MSDIHGDTYGYIHGDMGCDTYIDTHGYTHLDTHKT